MLLIVPILTVWASPLPAKEGRQTKSSKPNVVNDDVLKSKEVIDKLIHYYKGFEDFSADFVQTTAHKMFTGKLRRAYGRVKFKKGGRMRWEYNRPDPKVIIYDGRILWVYEPEVPQVYKGSPDTERLRRALAFLTGEGQILKEYKVKKLNSAKFGFKEGYVLGLWPKDKSSPFKHVELYLESKSFSVVRSVVVDKQGNRNRFDFYKMQRNKGLSDALFNFAAPAGVPIHDLQQQPR